MADSIFTRALAQAAQLHASTQSLAHVLRVPERTLLRWMAGSAQMPVQAFHQLVHLLVEHETRAGSDRAAVASPPQRVTLHLGELRAQCPACEGVEFLAGRPLAQLKMTSVLRCARCDQEARHGELVRALATGWAKRCKPAPARRAAASAVSPRPLALQRPPS